MADSSICSVRGCDNPVRARGYCSNHYNQKIFAKSAGECSVDGCTKTVRARGLCRTHYRLQVEMAKAEKCAAKGCDKAVIQNGFCEIHDYRNKMHGDPLGGRIPNGTGLDFIKKILHSNQKSCIIWPYGRSSNGYPSITTPNGDTVTVSSYILTKMYGPRKKMQAAHSCGKGHLGCVNPNHLRWATPTENAADKLIHGTHNRGVKHGNAKLTARQVRAIYHAKGTHQSIADKYGISRRNVGQIKNEETWWHLDKD